LHDEPVVDQVLVVDDCAHYRLGRVAETGSAEIGDRYSGTDIMGWLKATTKLT